MNNLFQQLVPQILMYYIKLPNKKTKTGITCSRKYAMSQEVLIIISEVNISTGEKGRGRKILCSI